MNYLNRRQFIRYSSLLLGTTLLSSCNNKTSPITADIPTSKKLDKITLGIDWFAEAEYGGFYQAVATGIYQEYGLDVTIKMGGPSVNVTQLLMSDLLDFAIGGAFSAIKAVESNIPKITLASIFQKLPTVLLAHPNMGHDSLENLKGKPIYVSAAANQGLWQFLSTRYGFTDDQKRPYNFNVTPFLNDKNSAQQGIFSSEPFKIREQGGFDPVIFLLADYGFNSYSFTIESRNEFVEKNPDLVQRFIDASLKGWYRYFQNPDPANQLIKQDNPEMTDELIAYGIEKIEEYGMIVSGDAETLGIGAMTDQRWQEFFEQQVSFGLFAPNTDYKKAYTLDFINQGAAYYLQG
jgi:NitT/TauT family transport system substrate-binding protein